MNESVKWFLTDKMKLDNKVYKYLQDGNYIKPGYIVSGHLLEQLFNLKYHPDCWDWRGQYLLLKNIIESEGYFITQKDIPSPGFRILETFEMADFAKKKLLKNCLSTFKTGYVLSAHAEKAQLSEEDQKKMLSIQKTAARIALNQQNDLLKTFDV